MRKFVVFTMVLIGLGAGGGAHACDITLSNGADLAANVAANAGKEICLGQGSYYIGPSALNVPANTTIRGTAASEDDVVIVSHGGGQKAIGAGAGVTLRNFTLAAAEQGTYGILSYNVDDVLIWSVDVRGYKINIGVVGGKNIDIWDTFASGNGIAGNSTAEPNFWIKDSEDVTILYGELRGQADGPGGDGELGVYTSKNVRIDGTHVIDSGASAIYLVSCVGCTVENTVIERAGEWGLDVVQGSTGLIARNNTIRWSNFGGSVFETTGGATATYTSNTFISNRLLNTGNCNGINAKGGISGVTQSGNVSTPTGVLCSYP